MATTYAANTRLLMDWVSQGKLKPLVSHRYPLSKAVDALRAISHREVLGKIVIVP